MAQVARRFSSHDVHAKCREILSKHNIPHSHMSDAQVKSEFKKGVTAGNAKKMYWLDDSDTICCEVFAKGLTITCLPRNSGTYKTEPYSSAFNVEVFEAEKCSTLKVHGNQNPAELTKNANYQVLFDVKVNSCPSNWEAPTKFTLTVQAQTTTREIKLKEYIGKGYVEIPIGKFNNKMDQSCPCNDVEFELQAPNGSCDKSIVIRGVIIRHVDSCA